MSTDQPKQYPLPLSLVMNALEPTWTIRKWAERNLIHHLQHSQEALAWMKEQMGEQELPK